MNTGVARGERVPRRADSRTEKSAAAEKPAAVLACGDGHASNPSAAAHTLPAATTKTQAAAGRGSIQAQKNPVPKKKREVVEESPEEKERREAAAGAAEAAAAAVAAEAAEAAVAAARRVAAKKLEREAAVARKEVEAALRDAAAARKVEMYINFIYDF